MYNFTMFSDVEKTDIILKENLHAAQSFDRIQDVVLCKGEGNFFLVRNIKSNRLK